MDNTYKQKRLCSYNNISTETSWTDKYYYIKKRTSNITQNMKLFTCTLIYSNKLYILFSCHAMTHI